MNMAVTSKKINSYKNDMLSTNYNDIYDICEWLTPCDRLPAGILTTLHDRTVIRRQIHDSCSRYLALLSSMKLRSAIHWWPHSDNHRVITIHWWPYTDHTLWSLPINMNIKHSCYIKSVDNSCHNLSTARVCCR